MKKKSVEETPKKEVPKKPELCEECTREHEKYEAHKKHFLQKKAIKSIAQALFANGEIDNDTNLKIQKLQ